MVYRRKNQTQLPLNSTQIKRMLGLKQAPRGAALQRQDSDKKLTRVDSRQSSSNKLQMSSIGIALNEDKNPS